MKQPSLRILFAVSVVVMSLACSLFAPAEEPPTPNYIFTPSLVRLVIEPESLPNAKMGADYEVEIRVSDAATPVNSVSISSGALPAGLELVFVDHVNGATISGMPEEAGTFTFTVFVTCFSTMVIGQSAEKDYVIVVE